jgi:hypothetical protein
MPRSFLVQGARQWCLCLADGAALQLKEGVVVMHGKGNHAQEKKWYQEQANTAPDTLNVTIICIVGWFINHETFLRYSFNKVKHNEARVLWMPVALLSRTAAVYYTMVIRRLIMALLMAMP